MKKNGFTLIELLAVIVILAIIALIATPIVLNIIKDSKESAQINSANMYLDAVEQTVAKEKMNDTTFNPNECKIDVTDNKYLICDNDTENKVKVEVKGEKPKSGTITFKKGKIDQVTLIYKGNKTITKDSSGSLVYNEEDNGSEIEILAPGLYNENNEMVMSWDELLEEDILYVYSNGKLSVSSKSSVKGKLVISSSVKSLDYYAFGGCTKLTSIILPDSVTSIAYGAFKGCKGLTTIEIPDSVTSIGMNAFENCTSLVNIEIPDSVTSIAGGAFENCTSLTSVTIPNSVTSIEHGAFNGCIGLEKITVDEDNTTYDSRNNSNAIIETATNTLIQGCKNTTIPNSVTSIGNSAFKGCKGLTTIEIPNSVTSIGSAAFRDNTNLISIEIPDSVTSIGGHAFMDCTGLTIVELGNSVKDIGNNAFEGCTSLTSLTLPDGVTSVGRQVFKNCKSLKSIYIPASVTEISTFSGTTNSTGKVYSADYSPFVGCVGLKIYTGVVSNSEIPSGWNQYWNYIRSSSPLSVTYNITRADYEANYK